MDDISAADMRPAADLEELFVQTELVHMIWAAARLGIADLLKDGPLPAAELAAATGTHERSLYRLLRALASCGLFREDAQGRFALTASVDPLRRDAPNSVHTYAANAGSDASLQTWADLAYSLRTGKPAFEHIFGKGHFEYLSEQPEMAQLFNDAMTGNDMDAAAIVAAHDFSPYKKIVDVGGGHGAMLARILDQSTRSYGVLFDTPQVVAGAAGAIDVHIGQGRAEKVAGDFFAGVPAGGDAYVLKWIVHDWDDERAITILRNCRQAMAPDGRVLLMETVIPARNALWSAARIDIIMLLFYGGAERTEAEYADLLQKAGLVLVKSIPTARPFSILEAVPI